MDGSVDGHGKSALAWRQYGSDKRSESNKREGHCYSVLVLSARTFGLCEWARFFDYIQ